MDNNFCNSKRNKKKTEKVSNHIVKVAIVQMVTSLIITGVLFAVCSTETKLSQNIKTIYSQVCEQDFAVSRMLGTFKDVVKQTFSPTIQEEKTTDETTESITGEELNFSPVF